MVMGATIRKAALSLFLTVLCTCSLFAQNPVAADSQQWYRYNITQFGNETWDFVKQPTKWKGSDLLKIGMLGAGTFLIMETADQPVRDAVLRDQRYSKSVPIEFGRIWGELYSPVVLFGGFAIHSLLTDNIRTRKIAFEIGQASLYAGAVAMSLKTAIGRARPYMNRGTTTFHPFSSLVNQDYHSLPGGHTFVGCVVSTVLSRNAKPVWLKVLAYLPASLTFVSRIYQDKHWTSDDFLGAGLGYFIATWVVDQHENKNSMMSMSSPYQLSIRFTF
jgi:membrane-associated phospholipid phosphatase